MNTQFPINKNFIGEIKSLIEQSKQNIAVSVNSEMTLLYWQIDKRVHLEILKGQRADYGKQVINLLSKYLVEEYGHGWSGKQLRHCMRFADIFPDFQIVSTLWRQLSWSHIKVSAKQKNDTATD